MSTTHSYSAIIRDDHQTIILCICIFIDNFHENSCRILFCVCVCVYVHLCVYEIHKNLVGTEFNINLCILYGERHIFLFLFWLSSKLTTTLFEFWYFVHRITDIERERESEKDIEIERARESLKWGRNTIHTHTHNGKNSTTTFI